MENIIARSVKLNSAIKKSKVYKAYVKSLNNLREHPELLDRLHEFKAESNQLENAENPFDETKKLTSENVDLLRNEFVAEFLKNEQILLKALKQMYEEIAADLELL